MQGLSVGADDGSRLSPAGSVRRCSERPPDVYSLPRRFDSHHRLKKTPGFPKRELRVFGTGVHKGVQKNKLFGSRTYIIKKVISTFDSPPFLWYDKATKEMEVFIMKEKKVKMKFTDFECNLLINGINEWRNMLLAVDYPTEDVDELLLKIIKKAEGK